MFNKTYNKINKIKIFIKYCYFLFVYNKLKIKNSFKNYLQITYYSNKFASFKQKYSDLISIIFKQHKNTIWTHTISIRIRKLNVN